MSDSNLNPNPKPKLTRSQQARQNGAKSKGPVTPEGKLRSSLNRLKHGRYSRYLSLLHIEDRQAFDALLDDFIGQYLPKDHVEFRLVAQLASVEWRKQRIDALDVAVLDHEYAIQAAALQAAGRHASPEQITALSAHNLLDRSKLPAYLAQRSTQLVREREATLRFLLRKRATCSPQLPGPQLIEPEPDDLDFDELEQPGSNPTPEPPAPAQSTDAKEDPRS